MAHFMGLLQGGRGEASRLGHKATGVRSTLASWRGALAVSLHHDAATGEDHFTVAQTSWHGAGIGEHVASGVIGKPGAPSADAAALAVAGERLSAIAALVAELDGNARPPSAITADLLRVLASVGSPDHVAELRAALADLLAHRETPTHSPEGKAATAILRKAGLSPRGYHGADLP